MKKTLWLLLDDRRGSVGQALGIAEAIGNQMTIEHKNIVYNVFGGVPNWIRGRSLLGVDINKSDDIQKDFPDIVLSTSRRTVAVARYIRKKSGYKTKIVQLMYPSGGVGIKDMEFYVIPSHDAEKKKKHPKAFVINGAPTRIFTEKLHDEKEKWNKVFANLPKPWTAVILGGAIKNNPWAEESVKRLADNLKNLHKKIRGSFLITSSRRTGKQNENLIFDAIKGIPCYTYLWGEKKENPIMGFYVCSDLIVATADSVSMCSEACGTGTPVLLFKDETWLTGKHQRFATSLIANGYAQDIEAQNALDFRPEKTLNPANEIAEKILEIC